VHVVIDIVSVMVAYAVITLTSILVYCYQICNFS